MTGIYVIEGVNPEPWTPGQIGVNRGRKFMYKDAKLTAFQKAVAGEMKQNYPGVKPYEGLFTLHMWFWRSTEGGNVADRTNLQKALEDALQKILYPNDQLSLGGHSEVVEQAPDTEPRIVIEVRPYEPVPPPNVKTPTRTAIERTEETQRRADYDPNEDF